MLNYYAQLNGHYLHAPRVLFAFRDKRSRDAYVSGDSYAGTLYALREKVNRRYAYKWYDLTSKLPMALPDGCIGAYMRK